MKAPRPADAPPEERTSERSFRRDPGGPFDDYRIEQYAKARAKGGSVPASATATGISKATALRWEAHPEVRARVRELREGAEDFVGVSKAWVITQLKKNVEVARENNAVKASNEALIFIYKILMEDKQVAHQMASAKLPATAEGMDLQKALRASFSEPEHERREVIDVEQPEPEHGAADDLLPE